MEESSVAEAQLKDGEAEESCFRPREDPVCAAVVIKVFYCYCCREACWVASTFRTVK